MCFDKVFRIGTKLSRSERIELRKIEREAYLERARELARKKGVEKADRRYGF